MFETQKIQTVPNGLVFGENENGSGGTLQTSDATPVEVFRRTVPENSAMLVNLVIGFSLTSLASSGLAAPAGLLNRVGAAAPTFNTGSPSANIDDPDAIGVGINQIIDGNDYVVQVVGVAATDIQWLEAIANVFENIVPT